MDLFQSNQHIISLLNANQPFTIVRLGIGAETFTTFNLSAHNQLPDNNTLQVLTRNAGIHHNFNENLIKAFANAYYKAIINANALAVFNNTIIDSIQNHYADEAKLPCIHNRALEPFYALSENIIPWTHHLKDKKVLIINAFAKSMEKQHQNNFQLFNDKKLWLDQQQLIFYTSFQCVAGNKPHENWVETFSKMCNDISQIEFDIALLGCGGFGLPLCDFIKSNLNKSAIYIGGGIQLLFGIMGKRWENNPFWVNHVQKYQTKFVRPSGEEQCKNNQAIENSCYW